MGTFDMVSNYQANFHLKIDLIDKEYYFCFSIFAIKGGL